MKRRPGISDKSTTASASCQVCGIVLSEYSCYICKKKYVLIVLVKIINIV